MFAETCTASRALRDLATACVEEGRGAVGTRVLRLRAKYHCLGPRLRTGVGMGVLVGVSVL